MATKTFDCEYGNCEHYDAAVSRNAPASRRKGCMPFEEVDIEHLHDKHLRVWGEIGWEKYDETLASNDYLLAEINKLREEVARLKKRQPAQPAAAKSIKATPAAPAAPTAPAALPIILVDERNFIDGLCRALVTKDNAIYRCTDAVRYGRKVCALHLDHSLVMHDGNIPPAAIPAPVVAAPVVAAPVVAAPVAAAATPTLAEVVAVQDVAPEHNDSAEPVVTKSPAAPQRDRRRRR